MALTLPGTSRPEQAGKRSMMATLMFALLFIALIAEWPVELDPVLFYGKWRSSLVMFGPLFTPIPGISLLPWQLMLMVLAPFCLRAAAGQRSREMERAILVSLTCFAVTFLWGLVRGGSAYFAYYQVWRFLTALLIAYMLISAMRTPRDLATLGKLIVIAALIRASLCIYYYWNYLYGKVYPLPEYVTNHDDSMLFVVATLIMGSWAVFKGGRAAWTATAIIVPYVFYAIVLNDRRIAWVELVLAIMSGYFLIGASPLRSRINRWILIAAPFLLVYFVIGWNSQSPIFAPVQALSSAGSDYDPSSLTRQEEARNLLHTLVDLGNPIMGTGWGMPYDKVESYWSNYAADWILVLYTPHNSLLGLAVFSGLVGIIGIWGVVPLGAFLASRGYRGTTEPISRTAAMVAIGSLAAYSAHCYGDVGLQSFPCSLLFGVALGAAGKVGAWSEVSPATRTSRAAAGATPPAPGLRPQPRATRRLAR